MIDLRCQDVTAMLASLPDGSAALIHADPPWEYSGGPPSNHGRNGPTFHGLARIHYGGLSEAEIAAHIAATVRVAMPNAYLAIWCTFPKLWEWMQHTPTLHKAGWQYVSGGAWGKTSGGQGVGFHFRGDAEFLLLYKRGKPKPHDGSHSNFWLTEDATGAIWLADRQEHSEKPQNALRTLVRMVAPDALVVDLYAGQSASLARACRALGRRYVGAELSEARWQRAMLRLSQQEMAWEGVA